MIEVVDNRPRPQMTERRKPRTLDPELQAMARIDRILAELSDDATTRVVDWIVGRNNQRAKTEVATGDRTPG